MKGLAGFFASAEEQSLVARAFQHHQMALDFMQRHPKYLKELPLNAGVYFICGRRRSGLLKVYVGKANNIQRRIEDYHRAFQPHCPNDRKMAFFQAWLTRIDPSWELSVYTLMANRDCTSKIEAQWIERLDPLVNARVRADEADRLDVHDAFARYFDSFFSKRLLADHMVRDPE